MYARGPCRGSVAAAAARKQQQSGAPPPPARRRNAGKSGTPKRADKRNSANGSFDGEEEENDEAGDLWQRFVSFWDGLSARQKLYVAGAGVAGLIALPRLLIVALVGLERVLVGSMLAAEQLFVQLLLKSGAVAVLALVLAGAVYGLSIFGEKRR